MSTNARINLIATALVAILFALGGVVGFYALGGTPTPTEAVVPATDSICTICTGGISGGDVGNIGTPPPATMLGNGGTGGSGSGGTH